MADKTHIKQEEVPAATDALDILHDEDSSSLDTNALLFDLTELLKRDPTLSSLNPVKDEPIDETETMSHSGLPIPGKFADHIQPQQMNQEQMGTAASSLGAFGTGSSSLGSSNVTASPLLASPPTAGMLYTNAVTANVSTTILLIVIIASTRMNLKCSSYSKHTKVPMTAYFPLQTPHNTPVCVDDLASHHLQKIRHPVQVQRRQEHQKMDMDTTPPPNVTFESGSGASSTGVRSLLEDFDLNDYFTSDKAKNVSLHPHSAHASGGGNTPQSLQRQRSNTMPSGRTHIKTEHVQADIPTFLQADDNLIFSSTSFSSQSGGAAFATSAASAATGPASSSTPSASGSVPSSAASHLLSSSVPGGGTNGSVFHNSPLSDILNDLSMPSTPATVAQAGASPIHDNLAGSSPSNAGPERHSTLHKLLLRKDPVLVGRPSPVRSPESRGSGGSGSGVKTLDKIRSSLSASNPLLAQQLSQSAPSQQSYLDRVLWSRREPRQHIR